MRLMNEKLQELMKSGRRIIRQSECYICGAGHYNKDKFCSDDCRKAFRNKSIDRQLLVQRRIEMEAVEAAAEAEAAKERAKQEKKNA